MPADTPRAEVPTRRALRSQLFWAARWLRGGAAFHRGPVRVVIDDGGPEPAETLVIRPAADDDAVSPDGPPLDHPSAALAERLAARLLSPDAARIVAYIAGRGTAAAKVIAGGAGVERSKCYVLLGDLKDRGLIRDEGDGYALADLELWHAVRGAD
jgi:hypothetical protein